MKHSDKLMLEIIEDIKKVEKGKMNPRLALVKTRQVDSLTRLALGASLHMRYQKRVPRVILFDSHAPKEETQEEKVSKAAKVLSKSRKKKTS